jgi:ribosomal protein S12 methylthiotransferase accessory factor
MNKNSLSNKTYNFVLKYLNSSESLITDVFPLDCYNDYPKYFQYITKYKSPFKKEQIDLCANGLSFNRKTAFIKAVLETLERWHLVYSDPSKFIKASYRNLVKKGIKVINPKSLINISHEQYKSKKYKDFVFNENSIFFWTKLQELNKESYYYVPAQMIYYISGSKYKEPIIRLFDTAGAAAGSSIEQALYKGICELIERDAYAIMYYNRLPVIKIMLKKICNNQIQSLVSYLAKYYFKTMIFKINTDINIPTFFCLLINKTNIGAKITVGVKSDLLWDKAIIGSILEALQAVTVLRDIKTLEEIFKGKKFRKSIIFNRPILKRLLKWSDPRTMVYLDWLLSRPEKIINCQNNKLKLNNKQKLDIVSKKLSDVGINNIYWIKTSSKGLDKHNLYTTRVVIPKLQPLSLDEHYLYFGGKRLYSIPVKLGYRKKPIMQQKLNKFPHPFP